MHTSFTPCRNSRLVAIHHLGPWQEHILIQRWEDMVDVFQSPELVNQLIEESGWVMRQLLGGRQPIPSQVKGGSYQELPGATHWGELSCDALLLAMAADDREQVWLMMVKRWLKNGWPMVTWRWLMGWWMVANLTVDRSPQWATHRFGAWQPIVFEEEGSPNKCWVCFCPAGAFPCVS